MSSRTFGFVAFALLLSGLLALAGWLMDHGLGKLIVWIQDVMTPFPKG